MLLTSGCAGVKAFLEFEKQMKRISQIESEGGRMMEQFDGGKIVSPDIVGYINGLRAENTRLRTGIKKLRMLVWGEDISSPTVPEYRELHEKMVKIMNFIDNVLLKEAPENENS